MHKSMYKYVQEDLALNRHINLFFLYQQLLRQTQISTSEYKDDK